MYFRLERIKKICEELKGLVYADRLPLSRWHMKEGNYASIAAVEQAPQPWREVGRFTQWGGRDVHAWFRVEVDTPNHFADKPVALFLTTGVDGWDAINPQFLVYVDGIIRQGADVNHQEVFLTECGEAERQYTVDIQGYGGMLDRQTLLGVELVSIDRAVEELYFDILVPLQVAEKYPEGDKTRIDMLDVLNACVNLIDLRRPKSQPFYASVAEATKFLRQEFYGKMCGEGSAKATAVGHTHIDVAWLWTLGQTRQKVVRSFATVLRLMEQYPEYVFMSSQPQLYQYLKEDHPELYEQVKERIEQGRWEADGAMWVEADCNLASGEALVRQVLYGIRFFAEEFGVKNRILWLPDVFGYSAALPQILRKAGIEYFMTTKISWNQFNKIPYDTFLWKGLDGTAILTHFVTTRDYEQHPTGHYTTYNGQLVPSHVMGAWQRYQQKDLSNEVLISYGYGDGGGGPTKEMLEAGRRMAKGIPGCPQVVQGTAGQFFDRLAHVASPEKRLPQWVGELYLEYHRGTYTSMARNKRDNRKSELLYQDVEFLSSFAATLGRPYPQAKIAASWKIILTNQFHDILPGSSIQWVYDESKEQYEQVLAEGQRLATEAIDVIAANIDLESRSVVVFNTLSHTRDDVVSFPLPDDVKHPVVICNEGVKIDCQVVEGPQRHALFTGKWLPAKGYAAYSLVEGVVSAPSELVVTDDVLENRFYMIRLDDTGAFTSVFDKGANREVLKPGERGNVLQAFEDKPMKYDNWDIDIYYQEKMWEVDHVTKVEVLETGPIRGCLAIHKKFGDSTIVQKLVIYRDIPRIDVDTFVDWKENQVLLKAAFPVDIHSDKATYDIQFGNVERPTHWNTSWDWARFEVCAHKWVDLSEYDYGVSLLNDCKYGHDIKDGVMRITLLKSGNFPYDKADREEHSFVYSLYPHQGDWRLAHTVNMAQNLNVPTYARVEEAHAGTLPTVMSAIAVDVENVIVDTVKKAEDSDATIVRLYECFNKRTNVTLTFHRTLRVVTECDLLEGDDRPVDVDGHTFRFTMKPYEIKTFKLQ